MMAVPKLSYVALVSTDVAAACRLLGDALGLARTEVAVGARPVPVFAIGGAALAIFSPGDPYVDGQMKSGVHHIGLDAASAHPPIPTLGDRRPGLGGTDRQALDPAATAGVRVFLTAPLAIERHTPPLIERIDHIGIASADNVASIAAFAGHIGLPIESQQTDMEVETAIESFTSDKYGVIYHSRAPRVAGGLRVAFLTTGDCELEFLQNFDPAHGARLDHGASGNTRQDQSAITKFIGSRGAGLHHVALKSPDINATLAVLASSGATMIDQVGRPGSRRALIGFAHPRSFGGILFHVVQRD